MSRFFLCTSVQTPRGNAASNYVLHLAQALTVENNEVILIGKSNDKKMVDKELRKYNDKISYINIPVKKRKDSRVARYQDLFEFHFAFGKKVCKVMDEFQPKESDYVIFYTTSWSQIRKVLRKYSFISKSHFSIPVVEWMQPEDYKIGILDPAYMLFALWFYKSVNRLDKILPISKKIEDYYKKHEKQTLCLPPLIDPPVKEIKHQRQERIQFIYSGGALNKDSIDNMIFGFYDLPEDMKKKVCFHLTGISDGKLKRYLGERYNRFEELENQGVMVRHNWLEYEELLELYSKMDFMFLARPEKKSTLSNFPSKLPEVMAYGIIPVCSKVGDYANDYLVDGEDSIIFEGCSEEACMNTIIKILELQQDQIKKLSDNVRIKVEEAFYYNAWYSKILDFLYREQ